MKPFCEKIITHIVYLWASITLLSLVVSVYFWGGYGLFVIPFVPFIAEAILRVLMRLSYGQGYKYRILQYFLIGNDTYGYSLRPNSNSKKVPFNLYEKYSFKADGKLEFNRDLNLKLRTALTINSKGFRGPEFQAEKAEGTLRIFCTGGSTTAGFCIDDNDTWPAQLQQLFEEAGFAVEVINGGVYGWDSYHELLRFQHEIIHYQPDIVLIHQGWNEEFKYSSMKWSAKDPSSFNPRYVYNHYEKLHFFRKTPKYLPCWMLSAVLLFKYFTRDRAFKKHMSFTNANRWLNLKSEEYIQWWFDNLMDFFQLSSGKNIQPFLVRAPSLVSLEDSKEDRSYYIQNSRLTVHHAEYQACSKERINKVIDSLAPYIPTIDGEARFTNFKKEERLKYFSDELHLTAEGETLLARSLFDSLTKNISFDKDGKILAFSPEKIAMDDLALLRSQIGRNPKQLDARIDKTWSSLKQKNSSDKFKTEEDLPSDRYTVY